MRSAGRIRLASSLLAIWLPACANFVQAEQEQPAQPAELSQSQRDLDDALCWQELGFETRDDVDDPDAYAEAHAACMAKKGWGPEE